MEKKQCTEFLKDLEALIQGERDNHFLGSIVYIKGEDEDDLTKYIIIDGQQRITTIMLFLKAIYDLSQNKWEKEDILSYLTNRIRGKNELKLKPIKNDNEILEQVFQNNIINLDKDSIINLNKDSIIYVNYLFFIEYLKKSLIQPTKYLKALGRVNIVSIELDREKDDPQLIFESINSTGLSLSEADLIRNFILMDKEHNKQIFLFENYWSKIEDLLTNEIISSFIRDYLTMKTTIIPKKNKVYIDFKNYLYKSKFKNNSEELLEDLLYYANIYSNFLKPHYDNKNINTIMKEIIELKKTVIYPYLLSLLNDYQQNIINDLVLIKSLKLIRNYIFRRLICGSNNNVFTSLFPNLHKELKKVSSNYIDNYYEYLAMILTDKRGSEIFPRDEEFKNSFKTKDIYNSKDKSYILYSLESFNNKELVGILHKLVKVVDSL